MFRPFAQRIDLKILKVDQNGNTYISSYQHKKDDVECVEFNLHVRGNV